MRLLFGTVVSVLLAVVAAPGCGSGSPTSPTPQTTNPCVPQTAQCLLDAASISVTVNNVGVDIGSTATAAVGTVVNLKVDYMNTSGQTAWTGVLYVRDDGRERFSGCFGSGAGGSLSFGGFASPFTISANDLVFTSGHTAKVLVVAAFRPFAIGSPCPLRTSAGEFDHTAVQGQRYVMTLAVQ